jgi:hypothetical protein
MKRAAMDLLKKELLDKLLLGNTFWSYDVDPKLFDKVSDDFLIEKVLLHLDIDDIIGLFDIYSEKKIKEVWKSRLCPLEPYYHDLNLLLAGAFFHIKNPAQYIKMVSNRHHKSLEQ